MKKNISLSPRLKSLIVFAGFLGFLSVNQRLISRQSADDSIASSPTPAVSQPVSGGSASFTVLGAKTSLPISWKEEPVDSRRIPWYAPAYIDATWPAGELNEKDTVPSNRSKLWRVLLRVDAPPSPQRKIVLYLFGDDDLTVYFDGFLMGKYGNVKNGGNWAGPVEINITNRLTTGMHVIGVRLDNVTGASRFSIKLRDQTPDRPEQLKAVFWETLSGSDDAARREMVLQVRQMARQMPQDQNLWHKAILSFIIVPEELRDLAMAKTEFEAFKRAGGSLTVEEEIQITRAIGELDTILPRLRKEAANTQTAGKANEKLGDVLLDLNDLPGAAAAYSAAWVSNEKGNVPPSNLLPLVSKFFEAGRVDMGINGIEVLRKEIEKNPERGQLRTLASLYEKIGDLKTADELVAREKQWNLESENRTFDSWQINRAYNTGDFEKGISLINFALQNPALPASMKEFYGSTKTRSLIALGKPEEATKAAGEIFWQTTSTLNQQYLVRYLQLAKGLRSQSQLSAAASQLANLLQEQKKVSRYFKPTPGSVVELAEAYKILGNNSLANQYAQWALTTTPDIPLPYIQWYRGRAAAVLGDKTACNVALSKAQSLAPWHYWISQDLKNHPPSIQ